MAMADWQRYPSKLCQIKFELDINVYEFVKSLVVSLQSDSPISTTGRCKEISRIKDFKPR